MAAGKKNVRPKTRSDKPTLDGQPVAKLAVPVSTKVKIQELAKAKRVSIWGLITIAANHLEHLDIDWKAMGSHYPTAGQVSINRWQELEQRILKFMGGKKGVTVEQTVAGVNTVGDGPDISEKQAARVLENWVKSGKVKGLKSGRFALS